MIKSIFIILCLSIMTWSTLQADETDTIQVFQDSLANGLKILVLEKHDLPIASFQIWYKVGSRNERPGITGISHLLEHMMFKASGKIGPEDFSRLVQKYGGHENGFTSQDYTAYYENIAVEFLPRMMELEAGRMNGLTLDSLQFESERQVVLEERRLRENSPWGRIYEETQAAAYMAHPYGNPTLGWPSDLQTVKLSDLRNYYSTYYAPNNATCVIVGDVNPKAVVKQVADYFGKIPRGPQTPPEVKTVEPVQKGERRIAIVRQAQTPLLIVGFHGSRAGTKEAAVLDVLSNILTKGESSRLYRSLIYQKQLALYLESDNDARADPGLFSFYAAPINGRTPQELEQAMYEELEIIKNNEVTPEELGKAKNQIVTDYIFSRQKNYGTGIQIGTAASRGDWHDVNRYLSFINGVTPGEICQAARKYLTQENRTVATIVPVPPSSSKER
jgi:zinc protease